MADITTNLKVVQSVQSKITQALDQMGRYFDPGYYLEYFIRFNTALKELRAFDDRFSAVPDRKLPVPSNTSDNDGRGYLVRAELERLLDDVNLALSLALNVDSTENTAPRQSLTADPRKIFVVHGRNQKAADAMFAYLRSLDLDPIEWSEAIRLTGKGTPHVGEVLDVAFTHAQAIVVLFTGDDQATIDPRLDASGSPEATRRQPRPNVLFESGMALGRNPDRTIIVELGDVAAFSDIHGRHTVRIDDSPEKRLDLAERLRTAQCAVRTDGRTDWLRAGNFSSSIIPSATATQGPASANNRHSPKPTTGTETSISNDGIPPEALDILKILAGYNGRRTSAAELAGQQGSNEQRVLYFLDMLHEHNLASRTRYMGRPSTYSLNADGRKHLFDRGLL